MRYYQQTFPDASVTVKLHLLEDHMVPFLRRWHEVGFGLLGEQGSESIRTDFNNIKPSNMAHNMIYYKSVLLTLDEAVDGPTLLLLATSPPVSVPSFLCF